LTTQAHCLCHPLPSHCGHTPDHCRRPQTPRSTNWFLCRSSHLGAKFAAPSASALRRSRRRTLSRRHPMDWVPPGFLFARARAISSFPALILDPSKQAFESGHLQFFGSLKRLRDPHEFHAYLAPVEQKEWVVYAKPPFAGPRQVLDYVGRYTHRVAISNNRLLDIQHNQVKFQWKDYRDNDRQKTMTLSADEFIRRFLIHVLPDGFQRIRYYGFLSNCHRNEKL